MKFTPETTHSYRSQTFIAPYNRPCQTIVGEMLSFLPSYPLVNMLPWRAVSVEKRGPIMRVSARGLPRRIIAHFAVRAAPQALQSSQGKRLTMKGVSFMKVYVMIKTKTIFVLYIRIGTCI